MRTTQLPHLVALDGILTWSATSAIPAPMVSPLAGGHNDSLIYRQQTNDIVVALNGAQQPLAVRSLEFTSISEFARGMRILVDEAVPAAAVVAR